jgi:WD40 repeat protein
VYEEAAGEAYPRESPKAASDTADSLNNRALSFIDLGKPEEAEKCWEKALEADPNHGDAFFNNIVNQWNLGKISDLNAIKHIESGGLEKKDLYLSKIQLMRGNAQSALKFLENMKNLTGETDETINFQEIISGIIRDNRDLRIVNAIGSKNITGYNICPGPDGKRAALFGVSPLSTSGKIHRISFELWDIEKGPLSYNFNAEENKNNSLCFSNDGSFILTGNMDATVKLWNAENGKIIHTFTGHEKPVIFACFCLDGKKVLSCGLDGFIKLWDINNGNCISSNFINWLKADYTDENKFCYDRAQEKLYIYGLKHIINVWDIKEGKFVFSFGNNSRSLSISPDGRLALSLCLDTNMEYIKLLETRTGNTLSSRSVIVPRLRNVAWASDGTRALLLDYSSLMLYNVFTGKIISTIEASDQISLKECYACLSNDGKHIFLCGKNGLIIYRIHNVVNNFTELSRIKTAEAVLTGTEKFKKKADEINSLTQKKEIEKAISAFGDLKKEKQYSYGDIFVRSYKKLASCCIHGSNLVDYATRDYVIDNLECSCLSHDGKSMLIASPGQLELIELSSGKRAKIYKDENDPPADRYVDLSFSPDGSKMVSISKSGMFAKSLQIWDSESAKSVKRITDERSIEFNSAALSPDNDYLLSGSQVSGNSYILKLWHVSSGKCIRELEGHNKKIISLSFNCNNSQILSVDKDLTAKIWDINTGKCLEIIDRDKFSINRFNYEDEEDLINRKANEIVNVKNIACLQKALKSFGGINGVLTSHWISPDNKVLLFQGLGKIGICDLAKNKCVNAIEVSYRDFYFLPDGHGAVTLSINSLTVFDLEFDLSFPGWQDWDEGARPYLEIFLALHPNWTEDDFNTILIPDLQNRGYGWLRPEGVRAQLKKTRKPQ